MPFRVTGSIATGAEIWPGKMRYPIRLPKSFMDAMLTHFEGEVAVGSSFDAPGVGSLGEFIQQKLKIKMNPAVYVAALLIEEGYAQESPRRGFICFRKRPIEPSLSGEKLKGNYPKSKFHASGEMRTVNDPKAEAALGEGWADTPAAFEPKKF